MAPQNTNSPTSFGSQKRASNSMASPTGSTAPTAAGNPLESLYTSALQTNAGDYDSIMQQYKDIANKPLVSPTPIIPTTVGYSASPEFQKAMAGYSNLARTGGYSDADTQALRARGISPIRSIYASAQQGLNRQRALQGGYSPNYTAATARLSRDLSDQVSNVTTNVNAQLAQMIAEGKRAGLAGHGQLASGENLAKNEFNRINAETTNRTSEVNTARQLEVEKINADRQLQSVAGQQSLYGTTPALSNTFGNQVLQALQLIMQGQIAQPPIPVKSAGNMKGGMKIPTYGSPTGYSNDPYSTKMPVFG